MGKFKIKISYETGDSLNNYNEIEVLDLDFNDMENAKSNIKRIEEHYLMYKSLSSVSYRNGQTDEEILENHMNKDWFVNENAYIHNKSGNYLHESVLSKFKESDYTIKPNKDCAMWSIKLKADNGNFMQMSAFWTGYFNSLNFAEIIVESDETKIEF